MVLGLRRWCRAGCRWGSEELRGTPVAPMPPNPGGAGSPAPEGVGSSGPWSASPLPRRGVARRAAGRAGRSLFRGRAGGGPGSARLAVLPRRGGAAAGCVGASAPRGGWAHVGPRWRCGLSGASSVGSVLPPGFGLASKVERVHRGGWFSSRLERPAGCLAEAGRSASASAGPGAEAPVERLRGAPPWVDRAPEGGWAARRRRFSALPEGVAEPGRAEALLSRLPARRGGRGSLPRRSGSGCRSPLRAEARAGRGRVLSSRCRGKPRRRGRGAFLVVERARATSSSRRRADNHCP